MSWSQLAGWRKPCRTRWRSGSATADASSRIGTGYPPASVGSPGSGGEPEVLGHERDHVLQRPLLVRGARRMRVEAAPQQRAERVASVQRAVAATAEVVGAPPADAPEARRRAQEHV